MKYTFTALGILFSVFVIYSLEQTPINQGFAIMQKNIWSMVTLLDLYLGLLLFCWIIFITAKNKLQASLWSIAALSLGNPVCIAYCFYYLGEKNWSKISRR
jgi:uncharacterized membrane protein